MTQPQTSSESKITRLLIFAIIAGISGIIISAFSIAEWSMWLIKINSKRTSGANAHIIGRQGVFLSEVLLTIIVTFGCSLVLYLYNRANLNGFSTKYLQLFIGILVLLRFFPSILLLYKGWDQAWRFAIEDTGPQFVILMSVIQGILLIFSTILSKSSVTRGAIN